jgi:hypothetical protein
MALFLFLVRIYSDTVLCMYGSSEQMNCGKVIMETDDIFGSTNEQQADIIRLIVQFWKVLPKFLAMMIEEHPKDELFMLAEGFRSQVNEMGDLFSHNDDSPVSVSNFYRMLFIMRDKTQPLVIELEQIADEMGVDLVVPIKNGNEFDAIKLSEWIPQRLINH